VYVLTIFVALRNVFFFSNFEYKNGDRYKLNSGNFFSYKFREIAAEMGHVNSVLPPLIRILITNCLLIQKFVSSTFTKV